MVSVFVLLLAVVVLLCGVGSNGQIAVVSPRPGLFYLDASVVDVSGDNFSLVHAVAPYCPWVVIFYSDVCGACRWYAPTYSNFSGTLRVEHGDDVLQSVTAAAVNCASEVDVCSKYNIEFVPKLYFFYPSERCRIKGTCDRSSMEFVELRRGHLSVEELSVEIRNLVNVHVAPSAALREMCMDMHFKLYASKDESIKHSVSAGANVISNFVETTELYVSDITGAFFSTMHYDVSLVGMEPPERLTALQEFLLLVRDSLPSIGADRVLRAVESVQQEKPFSISKWQKAVVDAAIPFEGSTRNVQWRTCKGSSPQYRGFPCGLWLLYHSVTANAPANRKPLEVIQNYVRHYFSCKTCRDHFIQFRFNSSEDPVLQLWRAHNDVNARLAGVKEGADPLVPKRQFPTTKMCAECYDESGNFSEVKVADFLRRRYRWNVAALAAEHRDNGVKKVSSPAPMDATGDRGEVTGGDNGVEGGEGKLRDLQSERVPRTGRGHTLFLFFNVVVIMVFVSLGVLDYVKKLRACKRRDRD